MQNKKISKAIKEITINKRILTNITTLDKSRYKCANIIFINQSINSRYNTKDTISKLNLCQYRFCPICSYFKAKKICAKLKSIMLKLEEQNKLAIIHLELPYKQIDFNHLKENIKILNLAFNKLKRTDEFKKNILGYFKVIDFIDSKTLSCNPKFDCFLIVRNSYFKNKGYVNRHTWNELWQSILGFIPNKPVNTNRIIQKDEYNYISRAIYQIRNTLDISKVYNLDTKDFNILNNQVQGIRHYNLGGILKANTSILKDDNEFIQINELKYEWNELDKNYKCV